MTGQLGRSDSTIARTWQRLDRAERGELLSGPVHTDWSPSPYAGEVAYVSDRSGAPRVWLQAPGELARPVETGPHPVIRVAWSPEGSWLACVITPGGSPRSEIWLVRPDGSDLHQVAGFGTDTAVLGGWHAGGWLLVTETGQRAVAFGHDPADGCRYPLATGNLIMLLGLSADRRRALLRQGPRGARSLVVVDVPDGRWYPLSIGTAPGCTDMGYLSPDASQVYARSDVGSELARLMAVPTLPDGPATAAAVRPATELEEVVGAPDGRLAALLWNNFGGLSEVTVLETATGRQWPVALPAGALVAAQPAFSADGRWLAVSVDGPALPRTVWLVDLPAGTGTLLAERGAPQGVPAGYGSGPDFGLNRDRRLGTAADPDAVATAKPAFAVNHEPQPIRVTGDPAAASAPPARPVEVAGDHAGEASAGAPAVAGCQPELLRFASHDGLPLSGWLYRPAGDGPYPIVLKLHSGPEAQERPGYNLLYQSLVASGVAVFAPNVRGSSGFGRTFVEADNKQGRFAAIADVAACVGHLVSTGVAQPARVGCMGRSYGGYLTLAAMTRYPDLFAVGATICGMSDFATFYANTEPWIAAAAVSKYGHPEHDRELLHELSPLHRIDRLAAPLLVVHGANDTNVPVGESEQLVSALAARGIPHRYLRLDGEGHDFYGYTAREALLRTTLGWLVDHLTDRPAPGG